MRGVSTGFGPSSNVSATDRGWWMGPVGWNTEDTSFPEILPFVMISSPGTVPR